MKNNSAAAFPSSPKVSVIMPTYNGASFVCKSINSILRQSFKDFELIIVNDGSTDSTRSIIKKYRDKRVIYLENSKNSGTPAARNKGIRYARGEYIAFCDHDDIFYPNHLKIQSNFLDSHPKVGLVYADSLIRFCGNGGKSNTLLHSKDFDKQLLEIANFINPSEAMCRSECFVKAGLFDENPIIQKHSGEDWDLWLRIADHFPCVHIKKTLGEFTVHQNNRTIHTDFTISTKYVIYKRMARLNNKQKVEYIRKYSIAITNNMLHAKNHQFAHTICRKFYNITKTPQAIACLGLCYAYRGKFALALKQFKRALPRLNKYRKSPDHFYHYPPPLINTITALAYSFLGQSDIAVSLFKQAIHLSSAQDKICSQILCLPSESVRSQLLFHYIRAGIYRKAIKLSKGCGQSNQHYVKGIYYFRRGIYMKAIREFEKCIDTQKAIPQDIINIAARDKLLTGATFVYYNLGIAYLKTGDHLRANRMFARALKCNPALLSSAQK